MILNLDLSTISTKSTTVSEYLSTIQILNMTFNVLDFVSEVRKF
jgi:hypothetical protein